MPMQQQGPRPGSQQEGKAQEPAEQPRAVAPKRTIDEQLQKKLDIVESRLPESVDDIGKAKSDGALEYVQKEYREFIEKHKPDFREEMKLLKEKQSKEGTSNGSLDPQKYTAVMEEYAARKEAEGVGILPEPLEKIRSLLKKAEADAAPESVARKSLLALDKSSYDITLPALCRKNYSAVLEAIHAYESKQEKK